MRTLMFLRGLPGSGKSTFVKENNLENYTLSSDLLRVAMGSLEMNAEGLMKVNQGISGAMWKMFHEILKKRFEIGAFTVIDATNIGTKDMKAVISIAEEYRYRMYCVDFTDVPLDVCIERDSRREPEKFVGADIIERMAEKMKNNHVPGKVKVIKPADWYYETRYREINLNRYKKIHHIGDIHGCYTVLNEYLKNEGGLKPDEFYILIGDFVDRGIENRAVIELLYEIYDLPNVVLLEGNHEKWLFNMVNNKPIYSETFKTKTLEEINDLETLKKVKRITRKLRQAFIYTYDEKTVLCTHGGLSSYPENLTLINTSQLIKGSGRYDDMIKSNESFFKNAPENTYQVHGHRNSELVDTQVTPRTFNINDLVEYGGYLRVLQLDSEGFKPVKVRNDVFEKVKEFESVEEMVDKMKSNSLIRVKRQTREISSFNFKREAFYNKKWDSLNTKARGLFINTERNKIVARSYEKFFNLNERPSTKMDMLQGRLRYPVTAYVKENGFLGILGYDDREGILYCSKSETDGIFSNYFKNIITEFIPEEKLMDAVKDKNISLVFEVIDTENDEHTKKYSENTLFLLDIVENTPRFTKRDFDETVKIAKDLGVQHKKKAYEFYDFTSLKHFLDKATSIGYLYNDEFIEGFVIEDALGFIFKVKTHEYLRKKYLKGLAERIVSGKEVKETDEKNINEFITWVKDNYVDEDITNIFEQYDIYKRRVG